MLKTIIKNLLRFFIYSTIAFVLLKLGIGFYLVDVSLTVLMIVSYGVLRDLSKYFRMNSLVTRLLETDSSDSRIIVTSTIYIGAVLSPMAYLLTERVSNLM